MKILHSHNVEGMGSTVLVLFVVLKQQGTCKIYLEQHVRLFLKLKSFKKNNKFSSGEVLSNYNHTFLSGLP